uniref:Transposase Tc1-like domain-containing protein n=1 Tax=Paramormyrops kingsleyae TaxID=1676925 RepID=A0A3B3SZ23_9TELE
MIRFHLTEFDRGHIVGLHEAGRLYCAIARHVGHADVTVVRCWNQWASEGIQACRKGSGCPKQTTSREDRPIVFQLKEWSVFAALAADVPVLISDPLVSGTEKSRGNPKLCEA